jgi:hypothetical protein
VIPDRSALREAEALSCAFGDEIRLASAAVRRDRGFRFGPAVRGRAALRELSRSHAHVSAGWGALRGFAEWWCAPEAPGGGAIPLAFLEFDEDDRGTPSTPSVFFAVRRSTPAAAVRRPLALLVGDPIDGAVFRALDAAIRALPEHSDLLQVGAMIGRHGGIRLFAAIWKARVADYLKAIGYPGDVDRVLALHEAHADWCDKVLLQLDVGESIGARLGIEFDAQAPTPALRHAEWSELIARFVESGLCAPEKARELLAWRRTASPGLAHRDISHLKLVYDDSAPVEAKAYVFEERRSGDGPQLARN